VKKFLENEILAKRKKEFDILNLCKNNPKNVVLMPAGQQSIYLTQYLKAHSICVDFFVDNSPDKQGTTINSATVITFDEYKKISMDGCKVCCAPDDVSHQRDELDGAAKDLIEKYSALFEFTGEVN
jgi:hypothetical protein